MKEAEEAYKEIIQNGLIACFEVGDSVIYFEPSEKGFAVGTMCNIGLLKDFEYEYDPDFSVDENLQALSIEVEDYYSKEELDETQDND
jgi:hypothetical protein